VNTSQAFRIGPTLARFRPELHAWIVTRETWLRVALSREEAVRYARQMATEHGQPLDTSEPVPVCA